MSIVIHFNPAPYIPTVGTIKTSACLKAATAKLEMAPGIKHDTDGPVMTDDSSIVDLATSNTLYVEHMKDVKAANHHVTQSISCCFGLPYQDHNYGAPPPPTPPSYSPCPSPVRTNGTPEEETNVSVVPAADVCEETHEGSVTRCVCGFEHDDEYMICCDRCLVWQHVDCMGLDRNNMPDTYMCEKCEPRKVDRHKAKVLQARKKVAMTDSSDSDDNTKNSERRPKTRNKSSRRKKEEDKGDEKSENVPTKRSRNARNGKERMEIKRSKLRRNNKNKESTSTADEEAQDAWEYSVELCDKHFEAAINNQYTPEVQLIARTLQNQCRDVKSLEQLQVQLCQVDLIEGNRKRLFAACDIPRGQPLIEYKGKFLLTSQFYELNPMFNKRLYPYVLFYSLHQDEICVDASLYGNDARFIRRSCKPNSEICHAAFNGNVHLYISSTKEIFKDEEITIPFDFCHNDSIKDIDCACEKEFCVLRHNKKNGDGEVCERKRRLRRFTSSADDDGSHSLIGLTSSPVKSKQSPVKNSSSSQISPVSTSLMDHMDMKGTSDQEPEEQANERRKKMTREERKIDAIMRAFDQMEKAAKRRQQALDRMAQQRGGHPLPKTEEKQESVEKQEVVSSPVKEEEKPALLPPPPPPAVVSETSETSCVEEEKPLILTPISKPKKGKRRRGSGTQTRRRTRTNSGGSDIMSSDEKPPPPPPQLPELPPLSPAPPAPESYSETLSSTSVADGTAPAQESCVESPQTPVRKTKRLLLQEWMHEKSETTPSPACSSLQTEVSWTAASRDAAPTCYVRCTKDGPNAGGILAHHLRRSSSSGQLRPTTGGGQGSAKKRWLRQAMYDCNTPDELSLLDQSSMEALSSPLHNGCLSPNSQGEANSPGVSADDVVITPLKKRRLMRESIESMPSPKSPSSIQTSIDWTTSTASCQSSSDSKTDLLLMEAATDSEGSVKDEKEKVYHLQIKSEELLPPKVNGLRDDLFIKSLVTSCESNDMKIEVTSTPVSSGGNVCVNSGSAIDIDNLMFKSESTSEKIQDICLDVSQNSCCTDNKIVDANIVPVEKNENPHTFNDNLNMQSTNSKNSVATSDNRSPLICNQTSHKGSHHNSELTFCETEHSITLNDCKVEQLLPQQCVEEQSTAQPLGEEHSTTKLCEGAHIAVKQCVEEHLAPELHAEEKLISKQNKSKHLTIKVCTEEILAPKLCVEKNLAPKLCVEENFSPKLCVEENFSHKLCEEENIIIKTQSASEHLTTKLSEKEHLAPELCEEEHLAPKPCEEENIITQMNEGEHLTEKMCAEEHFTHQPCEVEHLMKMQCNEECLTVKQCGEEIETQKLHVEAKQLEENLSSKECEKESLISVNFHKKSSDDSADSVSLSKACNTISDTINVKISVSISEVDLSADSASPKPVDDFTSLTEVSNTVQSNILLETDASNGDSSAGMDTSENPIASELDLCSISSSSTDVHSVPVSSSVCSMSSESNSASVSNSVPISTSEVQSSSSENVVASVCSSSSASVAIVSRSPSAQPSSGSTKLKKCLDSVSKAISSPKKSAATTSVTCASATQKRKVSLSEYRLRMKESPSKNRPTETIANTKKNNILSISTAVSLDTTYEKQLSLAPLRLKGDSKAATSSLQQNKIKKAPKPKEAVASADETSKTVEKPQETLKERLSLTERLRREFGLEDDPEEEKSSPIPVHVSQPKSLPTNVPSSIKMAPVLSMVAQQPPPPPRLPRATLPPPVTPFNYPLTAPFTRPPFIVPQVQSNPYINHQPPITTAPHPSLHHQLATPHSMLPMMPPYSAISSGAPTLRPQVPPRDYATSVNAQNFASLVQPPPNPQGYHPMYQAGYFK